MRPTRPRLKKLRSVLGFALNPCKTKSAKLFRKPVPAVSNSFTPTRHSPVFGSLQPNLAYFRPQRRYSSTYGNLQNSRLVFSMRQTRTLGQLLFCQEQVKCLTILTLRIVGKSNKVFIIPKFFMVNFALVYHAFWRETVCASEFVLDIIANGYKILFRITPRPYSIENRSSATRRDRFVR